MTEKQTELKKLGYYNLDYEADEQDIRIGRILGKIGTPVSGKSLKIYLKYLEKKLHLPCEVKGMDDQQGKKFRLLEVNNDCDDETYGLFGVVKNLKDLTIGEVPLCDLEASKKTEANYQLLDDYSVWFVNNR